jgi:predicted PurR-regulated permease PerM
MKKRSLKKHARLRPIPYKHLVILTAAVFFALYGLITLSPRVVVRGVQSVLTATVITSTASVPANPDNTVAQALQAKEASLNAREQQLNAAAQQTAATRSSTDIVAWLSLALSVFLAFFVALNLYLQNRHTVRAAGSLLVDLRRAR